MTTSSETEIKTPPVKAARNNLTRQQQLQKLLSRKAGATTHRFRELLAGSRIQRAQRFR